MLTMALVWSCSPERSFWISAWSTSRSHWSRWVSRSLSTLSPSRAHATSVRVSSSQCWSFSMMSISPCRWLRSRESVSPFVGSDHPPGSASFCSTSERDFRRAASSKITSNVARATAEVLVSLEKIVFRYWHYWPGGLLGDVGSEFLFVAQLGGDRFRLGAGREPTDANPMKSGVGAGLEVGAVVLALEAREQGLRRVLRLEGDDLNGERPAVGAQGRSPSRCGRGRRRRGLGGRSSRRRSYIAGSRSRSRARGVLGAPRAPGGETPLFFFALPGGGGGGRRQGRLGQK